MSTTHARPSRPRALCTALRHGRKMLCRQIAALAAGPDDALAHGFVALVAAVEATFRHEELIMEMLGYVQLREHRAENAVVLSALHHVLPDIEQGDLPLARQVLVALDAVLALHRLSADLALAVAPPAAGVRARGHAARATLHVAMHRR
ncbi:MAG: hemerythrin [Massilia sp.]|nr:hemerythrin [Massilia sp.]